MSAVTTWKKDQYFISLKKELLQPDRIHQFLSTEAYWSLGIPQSTVEKAISESVCFGLYDHSNQLHTQIGFARVVTDQATFAWICDVYIEEPHRGAGLSKWLMACVMSHLDLLGLRRICLATKDAHKLYEKVGFEVTKTPENWLEIKNNDIYRR
jgi:GNAT superfamily N-acetyltransferase